MLAGLATAGQQVFNARQTTAYGTAIPATLVNFTAGVLFLGIVWGGIALASGHGLPALPPAEFGSGQAVSPSAANPPFSTRPRRKFIEGEPMKPATNRLLGRS